MDEDEGREGGGGGGEGTHDDNTSSQRVDDIPSSRLVPYMSDIICTVPAIPCPSLYPHLSSF